MKKLSVIIPFSGFYESSHDAMFDSWLEYEQETLAQEHDVDGEKLNQMAELFYSDIDWKAVHVAYAKEYTSTLEHFINSNNDMYARDSKGELKKDINESLILLKGKKIALDFEELTSPKYYNYETDRIFAKMDITDLRFMAIQVGNKPIAEKARERFTSRSGFASFYPSDIKEWPPSIAEWDHNQLNVVLECYIEHIIQYDSCSDINEALAGHVLMESASCNGLIDNIIYANASKRFTDFADSLRPAQ